MPPESSPPPNEPVIRSNHQDLEIKDAQLIFNSVWTHLVIKFGRERLQFPKELILLGGAPGAGKGTNTPFIMQVRDLTCQPIVMSALLDSPEAKKIKDAGGMVGDREAVTILFEKLLEPEFKDGAIIDGFPRTFAQVECLKMLYAKMIHLRREYYDTSLAIHFRQPIIHILLLFIDEKESVARQLKRGREVLAHNEEVRRSGIGQLHEERLTDSSEQAARHRYKVFKEKTYDALVSLKEIFHYHFINAQGPIEEVQRNIIKELQYQSSLELDPRTFDAFRNLPLASEIVVHARQDLVKRLDSYEFEHTELFHEVLSLVERKYMPIVYRHAISGRAHVNSEDPLLEHPLALVMLIDIFSERGFHAIVDVHKQEIPSRFNLQTGEIECRTKKVTRVQIHFRGSEIRRGSDS